MRFVLTAALLALPASARADDSARAVVEKAVKAAGYKPGDEAAPMTWKDKGTFHALGTKMEYTGDWAFLGPDKYRFAIKGDFGGMKIDMVVVANGSKAWGTMGGMTMDFTDEKLKYTLNEAHQLRVGTLLPLLSDKDFRLASAAEKDVGGKKAAGVTVSHPKHPPVTLYFDKQTGLLAKMEGKVADEFQGWKEVTDESYFEDYADVNGRKVFRKMRVLREGKPLIEGTLSDQVWPAKVDAKAFEK